MSQVNIHHFASVTDEQIVPISISVQGDNTVITGKTGQTIRILKLVVVAGAAVNAILKSGSTALSGSMPVPTASNWGVLDFHSDPLILAPGASFIINLNSSVAVAGFAGFCQD